MPSSTIVGTCTHVIIYTRIHKQKYIFKKRKWRLPFQIYREKKYRHPRATVESPPPMSSTHILTEPSNTQSKQQKTSRATSVSQADLGKLFACGKQYGAMSVLKVSAMDNRGIM